MKNRFLVILILLTSFSFSQVKMNQTVNKEARDSINFTESKLMEFYESYDDGSPESLKKAKFNKAVDALPGNKATEKDKRDAYSIVNAYITGDKALEQDTAQQNEGNENVDDIIKETEEAKEAQKFLDQQKAMLMQMSYAEFEAYILKISPVVSKKDIKEAYNQLHKNDGKQVSITSEDEAMTPEQEQMWAVDTLQSPKSCEEYRKALKILHIEMPEEVIQKACQKITN